MTKTFILFIVIIFATIWFSCNNKTIAKFEIVNMTNETVDSLYILPDYSENNFIQIEAYEKTSYNINMTYLPKVDGNYRLLFKSKSKNIDMHFGYYTNGYPGEKLTRIFIHPDTVIIKQEYKNSY